MNHQPSSDEIDNYSSEKKKKLCDEYEVNKIKIVIPDANIDDSLGEEWKNKGQKTASNKA